MIDWQVLHTDSYSLRLAIRHACMILFLSNKIKIEIEVDLTNLGNL